MCQEYNGTRIYTKADRRNSGYWSEELCSKEQALRGASRGAPRARSEGPRSLPGSRCNTTLHKQQKCAVFGVLLLFSTKEVEEHEGHTLMGVSFVFWRRGMAVVGRV